MKFEDDSSKRNREFILPNRDSNRENKDQIQANRDSHRATTVCPGSMLQVATADKGKVYPGQHEAIVDSKLWDQYKSHLIKSAVKLSIGGQIGYQLVPAKDYE